MSKFAALLLLLAAIAGGLWLHDLDLDPKVPPARTEASPAILGSARGWSFDHVDPSTGLVEWEARGASASPDRDGSWIVDSPELTLHDTRPRAVTRTSIAAATGRAAFPSSADAVLRLEGRVLARRARWRLFTESVTVTLPEGPAGADRRARLSARDAVALRQEDPEVEVRAAGLLGDVALKEATLAPPVAILLDPRAITATASRGRLRIDTPFPVEMTNRDLGEDERRLGEEWEFKFTGETAARLESERAPPLTIAGPRGGKLRLRAMDRRLSPESITAVAQAIDVPDGELFEGGELVARGRRTTWDGADGRARLVGDALLRSIRDGTDAARRSETEIGAGEIDYRPSAASPGATLDGAVRARVKTPSATAEVRSSRAEVEFAPGEEGRFAPGAPRAITASGDVVIDYTPSSPVAVTGGASEAAAMRSSTWHAEGGRARLRFVPETHRQRSGERPFELKATGLREDVAHISLARGERQALLESRSPDPERSYELRGDLIDADLVTGRVSLEALPGARGRQTLRRGSITVEAQAIAYDDATLTALASGDVLLRRLSQPTGEVALEARGETALVQFSALPPSASAGALGRMPGRFELAGPAGASIRVVPELISATGEPARADGVKAERHPLELRAARVRGRFEDAGSRPSLAVIRAEGGPGHAVTVVPAYDAPPDERFALAAEGAVYDAARREVRLEGAAPLLTRGGDERLTARDVRLDLETFAVTLEGDVRGRFFLPLKGGGEALPKRPDGAPGRPLFDLSADRLTAKLARPGSERSSARDRLDEVDAEGGVHVRSVNDGRRAGGDIDLLADRFHYWKADRRLLLLGHPLRGTWYGERMSGEERELYLPEPTGPRSRGSTGK